MNTYDLVNPHDNWSFDAEDDEVAEAAVALVSGMYGWRNLDTDVSGGFLDLTSPSPATVDAIKATIDQRRPAVVAALSSFRLAGDRSSVHDPGAVAADLARRLAA